MYYDVLAIFREFPSGNKQERAFFLEVGNRMTLVCPSEWSTQSVSTMFFADLKKLHSLNLTLKVGLLPQNGNDHLPTIHSQVRSAVSFLEGFWSFEIRMSAPLEVDMGETARLDPSQPLFRLAAETEKDPNLIHPEKRLTWNITGWWFQIFFIFTPTQGNDPIWPIFFKWVETTN